jgi:hypothetical protein
MLSEDKPAMTTVQQQGSVLTSFLPIYDQHYARLLGKRRAGFRRIFEILEQKLQSSYLIIETGCARWEGNWEGDGQSTLMWDHFVRTFKGDVCTVDLDPKACKMAQSHVSQSTHIWNMDSVKFLWHFQPPQPIDLLYLDSFDLDLKNPHPSALHHIKELCAIMPKLRKGTLVAVDDNFPNGPGKGVYVAEFMANIGVPLVINDYQLAWIL